MYYVLRPSTTTPLFCYDYFSLLPLLLLLLLQQQKLLLPLLLVRLLLFLLLIYYYYKCYTLVLMVSDSTEVPTPFFPCDCDIGSQCKCNVVIPYRRGRLTGWTAMALKKKRLQKDRGRLHIHQSPPFATFTACVSPIF